jgi:hypothetical protein
MHEGIGGEISRTVDSGMTHQQKIFTRVNQKVNEPPSPMYPRQVAIFLCMAPVKEVNQGAAFRIAYFSGKWYLIKIEFVHKGCSGNGT